ncbi:hypothetical protein [Nitratireductor sp. GCM10026969]|uniref:hypothetical protein n=1 Tax=Nitratireductor sp. GCM10026969 TaxID=3252645 RepID=UPI00360AA7B2
MNQVANRETSINQVSIASGNGSKIAPQTLGEVVRFAEVMCKADIALPKHLRGNAGACMAVALQALEWEMSPFAVASKSYAVNGQIAYEAQLIMAVINTRSGIEGRLKFRFEGEADERVCIAYGKLDGDVLEVRSPKFKDITPKNSPLWKSDPDQQHCYYTARAWGRRHTPEVILGVYDRDEAQQFQGPDHAKDVTPSVMDRLKSQHQPQGDDSEREGFDADHVTRETQTLSGCESEDIQEPSANPPADDAAASDPAPQTQTDAAATSPADAADQSEAGATESVASDEAAPSETAAPASDPSYTPQACLTAFLRTATEPDLTIQERRQTLEQMKDWWKDALPDNLDFVRACLQTADKVAKDELPEDKARGYLEGLLNG